MSLEQPWKQYTRCGVWVFRLCLIFLITSFSLPSAAGQTLSTEAGAFLDYFQKHSSTVSAILEKFDSAPEESPWPFTKDKASYDAELNGYLDDAASLLLPENLINFRTEFTRINSELARLREAKSTFEADRALGRTPQADASRLKKTIRSVLPSEVSGLIFGVDVDVDATIRELEARREELVQKLRESLENEFGIILELKHCESLLYQVNGEDLLGGIAAARSLSEIEGRIQAILVNPNEDFATKVRLQYYELAVIVRLMVERLTERHLRNYDEKYLPALGELADENKRERRRNKQLLHGEKEQRNKRVLEHNVRSLHAARDAIDKYRVILKRKRDQVGRMLDDAAREARVAVAAFRTLEHVMSVGDVALRALKEFNALSELSVGDLLPLDDEKLYNDYLDISRQLAVKLGG